MICNMNINMKNNPSVITAEVAFGRKKRHKYLRSCRRHAFASSDEGVTPKASKIFVSFYFLPKATFGSYERRAIFHIYIHNVSQISANNY